MQLFYVKDLEGDTIELTGEEGRHCVKVLRLSAGDELWAADGLGTLVRCRVLACDRDGCSAEVVERSVSAPRRHHLHLVVAPTKNADRMEWLLEKATEMGLDELSLVSTRYTERQRLNMERLEKIAVSAMKQSLQTRLPLIHEIQPIEELLRQPFDGRRLVCHCHASERTPLPLAVAPAQRIQLLIGPEGDFSEQEVALAGELGFQPVWLGDNRLRTETAALMAVAYINAINNTH